MINSQIFKLLLQTSLVFSQAAQPPQQAEMQAVDDGAEDGWGCPLDIHFCPHLSKMGREWGIGGPRRPFGSMLIPPSLCQCPAADGGQRTTCLQL